MKFTFTIFVILSFSIAFSQTNYYTGFDNTAEQNGWTEYRIGPNTSTYQWVYNMTSPRSAPTCIAHFYPVGASTVTDDWFVSPVFDFSAGGSIDSIYHLFTGFG